MWHIQPVMDTRNIILISLIKKQDFLYTRTSVTRCGFTAALTLDHVCKEFLLSNIDFFFFFAFFSTFCTLAKRRFVGEIVLAVLALLRAVWWPW